MSVKVVEARPEDWPAIRTIYEEGIATGVATFEMNVPDRREWDQGHRRECRLVARAGDEVVGWAALSSVSNRAVYDGVAEVSVYVAASARGKGVGKALLQALITASEDAGIWTLQGIVFRENVASMALHKACGFREVGFRERVAQLSGVWKDTVLLERRSRVVG